MTSVRSFQKGTHHSYAEDLKLRDPPSHLMLHFSHNIENYDNELLVANHDNFRQN